MVDLNEQTITAIVVDIEGTIAPISFVKEVLFPFAAAGLTDYIEAKDMSEQAIIQDDLSRSPHFAGEPIGSVEFMVDILKDWIAKDYKDTTLKQIQGEIWQQGYETGQLKAPLYKDVEPFFARCQAAQLPLYSYSSGSIAAQRLFYQYNEAGDLRQYFTDYFDTTLGPKKEQSSYSELCQRIGCEPATVAFYSDSSDEIAAASRAGLWARQVQRPGDKPAEHGATDALTDLSGECRSS